MDPLHNRPAVLVVSADKAEDTYEELQRAYRPDYEEDIEEEKHQYSSLATYITEIYQENKDIRSSSGIEEKMLQSLRAYNGHYDPGDLALIKEQGGSSIFMNLTPTKCRAAMSWLRDIMMPAKENAWGLYPTTVPELPEEIRMQVQEHINTLVQEGQVEPPTDGNPQKPQALGAAQKIQEVNQLKRDIEDAFQDEIYKVALGEIKKYERIIEDQLQEGQWEKAFSDFIEDFCVFPVAVMKAPVISKRKKLSYLNGEIQESEDFVFLNQRVSPLDIYPSASATHINDGNLCEHLRFDRKTLYNFIGVKNYKEDNIRKVLELHKDGYLGGELNNTIESDKVDEEYRGDTFRASKGIIHGVHFFGSIPWSYLSDWGFSPEKIGTDEDREFEVEAILAGGEVIKCVLNEDPLLRRPYYKASWQNIPGSWWGRSLPELMRDIQRMCNATARALANNLALASGPQIEVYTDRLADDSSVDDITPFHVWQVTSDPSGAGGRAIQFWQPTSNAQELLAVYDRFELRADDATGIPRYAYGNDQTGAAAQALADYEKVITPFGPIKISKLYPGMLVNNTYGGTSVVQGVYPQGVTDIFRLSFSNGETIDCDMNHRWAVRSDHRRAFRTLTTEEILEKGLFRQIKKDKKNPKGFRPKWMTPQTKPLEYRAQEVLIDPYTFGALLGDGDSRARITSMDQEVFDRIPYPLGKIDRKPRNKAWSQTILGIKEDLTYYLHGANCYTKFIPKEYLGNCIHVRKELLKGLMDTDGCISKNGDCFYFTTSFQLAKDFKQLVRSLGGTVTKIQKPKDKRENRTQGYRIHFNIEFAPVYLERKKKNFKRKPLLATYITGISYVGKRSATCISVDSVDSCFLVENCIVTHNTASGLSMLLESASKGIKDAVRNIDFGVIKPRIEYQFYWNIISDDAIDFTGDVNVVPKGSEILTMKGASEMRRNEFLQILANPTYMGIVGEEGLADILREMAKSLGLGNNIVPSRIVLKKKQEEAKAMQQQQMQMQADADNQKASTGLQATQMQVEGQMAMHQQTQQLKAEEIQAKMADKEKDRQLRFIELQERQKEAIGKQTADLQKQQMIEVNKDAQVNKQVALSLKNGDKMNQQ